MSKEATFQTVKGLLASLFDLPEARILPAAHLVDDLDLDSLDAAELAHCLEDETGIEIADEDFGVLHTVADVVAMVSDRVRDRAS